MNDVKAHQLKKYEREKTMAYLITNIFLNARYLKESYLLEVGIHENLNILNSISVHKFSRYSKNLNMAISVPWMTDN
jgi:hypothetical protein